MATRQLQGWCADPFQLHEERYFSSGRPTKLVRDGKVESYEDPPSDTYEVPDDEEESGPESGPAATGRYPPGGAPRRASVTGQYASSPSATQTVRAQRAKKRSHALLITAAMAIVAATVAGMVVLVKQESHSNPNPNRPTAISPAAFVRQSAAKTLAERTADLTLSGSVRSGGRTVTVSGTGAINFSTNAMSLNVSAGDPGQLLSEQELLVNGNLYVTLTISGTGLAKLTGGRAWIEMPTAQSVSTSLVGSDPLSSLSLLEQQGTDVRQIGTKIIEGQSCTGYAVIPSRAALLAAMRSEFTKLGYSPALIAQEMALAQDMLPPTVTIWLDAQGLMREMNLNLALQTGGSGGTVTGSMVMYVSYYGSPVQVTAPPASDVISYPSFVQALGGKG